MNTPRSRQWAVTLSFGKQAEGMPGAAETFTTAEGIALRIASAANVRLTDRARTNKAVYDLKKNNGAWFCPGTNEGNRQVENFPLVDYLKLDVDKAPVGTAELLHNTCRYAHVIYPTTGNMLPIKDELECFRVLVPLRSPLNATALARTTAWLAEHLGVMDWTDAVSGRVQQYMYCPLAGVTPAFKEGRALNPDVVPADFKSGWDDVKELLNLGDADWSQYQPILESLLSMGGVLDKRGHVKMAGQGRNMAEYSHQREDAWRFSPPNGDYEQMGFVSMHANTEPKSEYGLRDALEDIGLLDDYKACLKTGGTQIANFAAKARAADHSEPLPQTAELIKQVENKLYGFCGWEGSAADFGIDTDALDRVLRTVGSSRSAKSGSLFYVGQYGKLCSQKETELHLVLLDLGIDYLYRPTRDALDAVADNRELKLSKQVAALQNAEDKESQEKYKQAVANAAAASAHGFNKTLMDMLGEALQREANQFTTLRREIDMFTEYANVTIDGEGTMVVSQPHRPFASGPVDQRHVDDYLKHFPEANEFLQFVAACRFAGSRKTGYLWLHAPSDWGKGFLMQAFKNIGAVIEFDASAMKDLLKGANTGKTDGDFIRAWLCVINECREIVPEMRKMENSVGLNTKYALSTEVPLYAKVFTSADGVDGLNSEIGADKQLCNRFNYLAGNGEIKTRELFMAERGAYNRSVFHWVAKRLNELVDYYRNMGRTQAADTADDYLSGFHDRHGIALTVGVMGDNYDAVRAAFIRWVHSQLADSSARFHEEHTERCARCDSGMVLRSVKKTFDEYLETHHAKSDIVWMSKDWKAITGATGNMQRFPGIEQPFKGLLLK